MGECGCIMNEIPIYQIPGPNGLIYVVKIYPSCNDCDAPAGVCIDLYKPEELEYWGLEETPIFDMFPNGKKIELGPAIPIIHQSILQNKLTEYFSSGITIEDKFDAEVVAEEFIQEYFRDIIYETIKEKAGQDNVTNHR